MSDGYEIDLSCRGDPLTEQLQRYGCVFVDDDVAARAQHCTDAATTLWFANCLTDREVQKVRNRIFKKLIDGKVKKAPEAG